MKYHELDSMQTKSRKRVGRGIAAGKGKTAGRGTKGQSARSGGKVRPGFEGGQNPLSKRIPKKSGFTSKRIVRSVVYTEQLNALSGKTVDVFGLAEAKIIKNPHNGAKLVVKGELSKALNVSLQGASKSAVEQIKKAGGTFTQVPVPQRSKKK